MSALPSPSKSLVVPASTVSRPDPVRDWTSGFVIVMSLGPGAAPAIERFRVTVVGSTKVAELTTTPPVAEP